MASDLAFINVSPPKLRERDWTYLADAATVPPQEGGAPPQQGGAEGRAAAQAATSPRDAESAAPAWAPPGGKAGRRCAQGGGEERKDDGLGSGWTAVAKPLESQHRARALPDSPLQGGERGRAPAGGGRGPPSEDWVALTRRSAHRDADAEQAEDERRARQAELPWTGVRRAAGPPAEAANEEPQDLPWTAVSNRQQGSRMQQSFGVREKLEEGEWVVVSKPLELKPLPP